MATKQSVKKINDTDYEIGTRYRLNDVVKTEISAKQTNDKTGIRQDDVLSGFDLEQMFGAYLDEQNVWTLNLNSSFYAVGLPDEVFSIYITTTPLHWPTVSYNIYGTTRLAWLLMKLNDVKDGEIFKEIPAATAVKYLEKSRYVDPILQAIREGDVE